MIIKYPPLALFKVYWFNPNLCFYVPLDGLRTAAWIDMWRALAKQHNYHTNIITTPFSKYHLIKR